MPGRAYAAGVLSGAAVACAGAWALRDREHLVSFLMGNSGSTEEAAAGGEPAPTPAAAVGAAQPPPSEAEIAAAAEAVRAAKAAGKTKEEVDALVQTLLQAKARLAAASSAAAAASVDPAAVAAKAEAVRAAKVAGKPAEEVDSLVEELLAAAGHAPEACSEPEAEVTPWEVTGVVDYDKLIEQFGCGRITPELIARMERVTGVKAHPLLARGCFFAHRDLEALLDEYEKNPRSFYLYTGRGPSSEALHLGHLVPFHFTKWLQDAFQVPLVIQLTDDEKFLWKDLTLKEAQRLARENAKDIIACGFNPKSTFIFQDSSYMGRGFYQNCLQIGKCVTLNQARGIFGFAGESNIGQVGFPSIQAAPSFPDTFPHMFGEDKKSFRCLIPCAIDQDPYFRMTRDVAPRIKGHKPALIESTFFPALKGDNGKMSASDPTSAIYVTDTPKQIKSKINKYAFSGGQVTEEEQRRLGANLSVDVSWKWLNFFLHDDEELKSIGEAYGSGKMLTGEIKARLSEVLSEMVTTHQQAKAKITDADVEQFFSTERRSMDDLFGKAAAPAAAQEEPGAGAGAEAEPSAGGGEGDGEKKLSKAEKKALKKAKGIAYQQQMAAKAAEGGE